MSRIELSDSDCLAYISTIDLPEINEWIRTQFNRGLDYYRNRVLRLGLRGHRALDAGCGVGVWSLGLSESFDEVHALEIDRDRLSVLEGLTGRKAVPIVPSHGSVTELPYPDAHFDCVFCNGVIFVVDYEKALLEFARVLRADGQLYVSFVGLDWWVHLLQDRAPSEPPCRIYGCNGLINLVFRRLTEVRFETEISADIRGEAIEALLAWHNESKWGSRMRRIRNAFSQLRSQTRQPGAEELESKIFDLTLRTLRSRCNDANSRNRFSQVKICLEHLFEFGGEAYRQRVTRDLVSRIVLGKPDYSVEVDTHTFDPEDMSAIVQRIGYRDILVGPEGGLQIDRQVPAVVPIYHAWQGVYELLAYAPLGVRDDETLPVRYRQKPKAAG